MMLEVGAAGDALAAEAVVVALLEHAAELDGVLALDPGGVVGEGVDDVLGAVVGGSAPAVVAVEVDVDQVLVAVRARCGGRPCPSS